MQKWFLSHLHPFSLSFSPSPPPHTHTFPPICSLCILAIFKDLAHSLLEILPVLTLKDSYLLYSNITSLHSSTRAALIWLGQGGLVTAQSIATLGEEFALDSELLFLVSATLCMCSYLEKRVWPWALPLENDWGLIDLASKGVWFHPVGYCGRPQQSLKWGFLDDTFCFSSQDFIAFFPPSFTIALWSRQVLLSLFYRWATICRGLFKPGYTNQLER